MGNKKPRQKDVHTKKIDSFEDINLTELGEIEGYSELPVDLSIEGARIIQIMPVCCDNFEVPARLMKITNSGYTAILSGKWHGPRPFVSRGPLKGSYVFTQFHFHWGKTDSSGSEHTANGRQFPLELHLMFFKSSYMTQDEAKKHSDGIVIFAYFFRISKKHNPKYTPIISALNKIRYPNVSKDIDPPFALSSVVHPVSEDYFLYLGEVYNSYRLLCFISRKPLTISSDQLAQFRTLHGARNKPLLENFRPVKSQRGRSLFLVSPDLDNQHVIGAKRRETQGVEEEERPRSRGDKKRNKFTKPKDERILRLKESFQESQLTHVEKPEVFYPQEIFQDDLPALPIKVISSIQVQAKASHSSRPPEVNEDDILPESSVQTTPVQTTPVQTTPVVLETPILAESAARAPDRSPAPLESPTIFRPPSLPAPPISIFSANVEVPPADVSRESHKEEFDEIDEKIRKFKEDVDDNLTISDSLTLEKNNSIRPGSRSIPSQPDSTPSSRPCTPRTEVRNENRSKSPRQFQPTSISPSQTEPAAKLNQTSPSPVESPQGTTISSRSVLPRQRAPLALIKPKPVPRGSPNRAQKMTPVREIFKDGGLSRVLNSSAITGAVKGESSANGQKALDKIKPWK